MPCVYKITNKINNKNYIGYTSRKDVRERIREHFSPSVYNNNHKPLYLSIKKYGKENFEYEILFESNDEEDALEKEKYFIREMGDYNLHPGGNVPPSQKDKKWNLTEETKQKMRKPKSPRTEEHISNLSRSLKGKEPWNKGKTGVQTSSWKGQRNGPKTKKWKIVRTTGEEIIENLVLWCEQNNYVTSTVKGHYYRKSFPYNDIINIEKVNKNGRY